VSKKKTERGLTDYSALLKDVKSRIRHAQTRAVFAANAELIRLYWDIGRMIDAKQGLEGWGAGVIPRLANDLRNEVPDVKGFSERNIGLMIAFCRAYPQPQAILQQPVAKLGVQEVLPKPVAKVPQPVAKTDAEESLLWSIPWGHHAVLLAKVKDLDHRVWYMRQTLQYGWSRNILFLQIGTAAHARQGKAVTNAAALLPSSQSDLVIQTLKDPYIFDFLTLEEPFHERELETQLLHHLERFLLELGKGFSFVGRQYRIEVGDEDFSIDLLFYHLKLRCFVVIDLKTGAFQPGYVGKMNFYLNVVDDKLRHETDARSIGLILCQDRNRVVAEYALQGLKAPIGVSEYELTQALPRELQSSLPSIETIEAELAEPPPRKPSVKRSPKKTGGRSCL
jgi:predicted nuclease of restriction endonuclease-like (RecB) superfamily